VLKKIERRVKPEKKYVSGFKGFGFKQSVKNIV
jgi:hypothetical protein